MVVRIRIHARLPKLEKGDSQEVTSGLAGFLTIVSVVCFVMSVWKLSAEMGWAGAFFIPTGVLSHWQVWIAGAVAAQLVSFRLTRRQPLAS
jgi:hypothetical protein